MGDVRDEPARAGDVPRHARWVRISHWILTVSVLTLAVHRGRDPDGPPAPLLGRGGQRPDAGAPRAADQPELPARRLGQAARRSSQTPRRRSARAGPSTSSIRTAGDGACTSWPHGASWCPASSICWPGSSAVTSARTSGPRARSSRRVVVWRDVVDHLRLRIPPATGGPQLRRAAEVRVLVCGLRRGAADGGDRPGDVAGRDRGLSVAVAPVRRLPVRAHDPLLRVRGARCCSCSCTS